MIYYEPVEFVTYVAYCGTGQTCAMVYQTYTIQCAYWVAT